MNTGQRGEAEAQKYYLNQGYSFYAANVHCRFGEIDLIFRNGEEWVFVEVKTRGRGSLARPAASVDAKKQAKIRAAALHFLAQNNLGEPPLRFDVAEVWLEGEKPPTVHRIENAF